MKMRRPVTTILVFFVFLVLSGNLNAQEGKALDKRSRKSFTEARGYYYHRDYSKAEEELRNLLGRHPAFTEGLLLMADVLAEQGKTEQAIPFYYRALKADTGLSAAVNLVIGKAEMDLMRYDSAIENIAIYLADEEVPEEYRQSAREWLDLARFRKNLVENPVPFKLYNLGEGVNSSSDEYVNAMTADEERLFFTRKTRVAGRMQGARQYDEDFYISEKMDGGWNRAVLLGSPVDSRGDAGAMSISPDGKLMYFTACYRDDSYGTCDIFCSKRSDGRWSFPENAGSSVNSGAWDSQPSVSPDGKRLFFASSRSGSYGKSDIFVCVREEEGWKEARNLGVLINTSGTEMAPFMHFDNRTLYFSSDGHLGMGGMDLFMTRYSDSAGWSEPVNLGYPLNTAADEITVIVNARGTSGFISADVEGGFGNKDIYRFEMPPENRPDPVTYVHGKVYDAESSLPLHAGFHLIELQSEDTAMSSFSDRSTGEFLVCLPTERNYALHVSKPGYLFYSEHFALEGIYTAVEPYRMDIPLKPIREGSVQILRNIFYDTDKYELKPESLPELNRLVQFLNENPGISVEISGHTDNVGTAEYNQLLSERRAGRVYEYLASQGIDPARLEYKGYGLTRPVADNATPGGRALNRRTEMKVTGLSER